MDEAARQANARRFAAIAESLVGAPGVAIGAGKGFGGGTLQVDGRIFAMCASAGDFVLKLPPDRVVALIAAGEGTPFETAPGRVMKAWICLAPATEDRTLALAREALAYVAGEATQKRGATPKGRP
ncbi:hypothetical protein [Niveibacterium sp. SC-1]|uniref:hypothetical protein n=1 Tax=Niveibacterium sp. SC-1 TaxID=3135646 RepID=UPI00311FD896